MADVNANIGVNIDTSAALANLKALQRQISVFHSQMAKSGAAAAASSAAMQQNLANTINQTGKFSASMRNVKSTTESFTSSLEKNKLSMGEYFRYAGASTKTFGRLFRTEFNTIDKVARERVKTLQTQYIKMGRDANGAMQAMAVRPLALDMQNLATQTQMAAQKQQLFNQLVKQGSTNLLNFGKNTQWAGRQLMVGFAVPLTMLGVLAGRTFMQIEEQAIRFRRVYGETFTASTETDKMLLQIKQLASEFTKYGVAVEKTMELAATAAASGKMGADLLAQVSEATRLAVLGGVEQEQALETTISLTNAFGIATQDLAKKINFLNAVENQTVVSIEDLTIAVPKAGPVIQQLGGDVEDLAFFLTAMKEGGINASEGANALKSGLAALINPTGKAADMLKSFGVNVQGIVEANKGDVKGLVIDFASALDTLDPLSRARAIEQLFGKFQFSRLSTLFKNVIQEGNQASRVLQLTKATTEELAILSERELASIENTTTYKFKKAFEDIKASLAPVGEEFLKALTPIIEIGTKILNAFNNLDSGTKTFIVNIVGIAGLIGPAFLMTFGLIANGFANLIKMFAFIGRAFTGVGKSSTDLAAQTQYMTNEQLAAAAVAASLDQTHMKLIQTFTSEAGAINALTQAYGRAVAAQLTFTGGTVGRVRAPKTKKYASGVMSVPGPRGAGDVVPAMLSPGEAIIPAKQAQKYSGIISSMISDNIPGFAFGRNPFASMLGKSQVGVRMQSQAFSQALSSGNKKYQSGFATGTGDDFLSKYGLKKPKQKKLRTDLEQKAFGLSASTLAGKRPTYGFASASPLQGILNRLLFGKTGARTSSAMNPRSSSLDRYGDISLITKGSVAKRSQAYSGDILLDYSRNKNAQLSTASMRGANQDQLRAANFDRFSQPFGSRKTGTNKFTTNPKPPYIETYTPGGFAFKEIDKIITNNPTIAKQLRAELKAAGLGSVRVSGSGFVARLFKKMGVPGYKDGTSKIPSGSQSRRNVLDDLTSKLRGAPESMRVAAKPLGYGSFGKEEKAFLDYYEKEILRENPNIGKAKLDKLLNTYRGYDLSHLSGTASPIRLADGTMIDAKIWNTKDILKDARIVNQILENMSVKGGIDPITGKNKGRGTFFSSLDPKEIAKMAGVSEKVAAQELESLINKKHPVTKDATKVLSAVSQKYGGARGMGLSRLLQARLSDTSPGSFFNAIASGKLSLGDNPALNKAAENTRKKRIQAANKKLGLIGSTTGSPIGPGTRRGGAPSDTRQVAVSKGEAILSKKSTQSIKSGGFANIPNFGRLGLARRSTLPGYADGLPDGQTQSGAVTGSKTAKQSADEFAKAAPLTREVKSSQFRKAFSGSLGKALTPKAFDNFIARKVKDDEIKRARAAGLTPVTTKSGNLAYKDPATGRFTKAPEAGPKPKIGGKIAAGAAGATMVGVMGASMMGGQIGEIANQLMMPIMMLSMIAPMLTNPIAIAIAGVAALAVGLVYLGMRLKDATRSGLDAGKAMSMTNEKLDDMANFTGKVTASQIAERQREKQLTGQGAKKRQFGQTYMESEAGKSLLTNAEGMVSSGMSSKEIASNFATQLSYAVMQGAVTQEQAGSIANGLAEKLGDYSIGLNINGQLAGLFGVNGENLLKGDPLQVSLAIQSDSMNQQILSYKNALSIANQNAQNDAFNNSILGKLLIVPQLSEIGDLEKNKKAQGIAVQLGAEQLTQNQGLLDSLEIQYNNQIAQLKAEKEAAKTKKDRLAIEGKITDKIAERNTGLKTQKEANADIFDSLIEQSRILGGGFTDSINLAIDEKFKNESGGFKAAAELAKSSLAGLQNSDFKATLQVGLASGEFDPITVSTLVNADKEAGGKIQRNFKLMIDAVGTADANQAIQLLNAAGVNETQYDVMFNFITNDKADIEYNLEALSQLNSMLPEYNLKITVTKENTEAVGNLIEDIKDLPDTVNQKVITDFISNMPTGPSQTILQNVLSNWDMLTGGKTSMGVDLIVDFAIGKYNQAAVDMWYWTVGPGKGLPQQIRHEITAETRVAAYIGQNGADEGGTNVDTSNTTDTGTGSKQNPLNDLLKQLKEVRNAAVNATGGIKELYKWLDKGKDMTAFKGTANALIAGGTTQDFQDYVLNLNTKEQEKYFTVGKNGLLDLKKLGKATQKAFNEITIGTFVVEQKQATATVKNQYFAAKKLVEAGMSYADAWAAVSDETLAASLAAAKNKKEIKEIVASFKEAKAAAETYRSDLEKIEDLSAKVSESFSRQSGTLDAQFTLDTADFQSAIMSAQNEIETLTYKLDDYNAGIQEIEWQEEQVNKKYEDRFEALDKIQNANQSIMDQAKSQLNIADALSKGDISAAARAVQELREKQAAKSIDTQRTALQSAQEKELAALTSSNGQTRKQLEDLILQTQKDIFEIEEKRLEPAQRAIELKQNELDLALFSLNQQQAQWEILYNGILNTLDPIKSYVDLLKEAEEIMNNMGKFPNSSGSENSAKHVWGDKNKAGTKVWNGEKWIPINTNPDVKGDIAGPENPGGYPGEISKNGKWKWNGTSWQKLAKGGMVIKKFAMGGVVPKKFFLGGLAEQFASGTDTVPAMLTPGEFVVRKQAVDRIGQNTLSSINNGESLGSTVYNSYSLDVNVATDANPQQIANTVIREIKRIDSQNVRGNKF